MEKETLRRQIIDEIQTQFESKLRDVRRQKSSVEEELESASERWRTERRRLNAEIERLMATTRPVVIDSSAVDEKVKKAALEWEAERKRLTSQIGRLERAVAEAIERSSNPLRSTQPLKEQFEARLDEAARNTTAVEQQLLRAKAEWDEDRKRFTTEIMRLRRLAPSDKALEAKEKLEQLRGRTDTLEETRIKELERRLSEAHAEIQQLHQAGHAVRENEAIHFKSLADDTLRATRELWEKERTEMLAQIQQLQRTLSETRDNMSADVVAQLRHQYDQKLQEMIHQKTEIAQDLQSATQLLAAERSRFTEEASKVSGSGPDTEAITIEVGRVETMILQIVELIDNPETQLSTVIRKNVEKAELDAYLKGILFSLGRGRSV